MHAVPTFRKGGVHPPDHKVFSREQEIVRLPLPSELVVALSQHMGAPAKPLKAKGDTVERGEKIGESVGFISADVHSPVNGTIKEIKTVTLPNSVQCDAFVITVDEKQPGNASKPIAWRKLKKEELFASIKEHGIVGLGGATFPAHVKFTVPRDKKVEYFVVNGVECEPYLTSDYRLMMEKGKETLEGILIAAKILEAEKIIVGVELNKQDAIDHLKEIVKEKGWPIEVVGLKVKYPQGDEKQLLKAAINREIPSGKLPLDVGAVVSNIGTCYAIYEAIVYKKSLYERIISVTGEGIVNPKNILAPIGTKVSDLLEFCGGLQGDVEKLVSGGPMMGFAFFDTETPVTKGSSGILALHARKKVRRTPCISCGKCVDACPIGLMPTLLYKHITNLNYEVAMNSLSLLDCKECGSCSYVCPAHLPLVHTFKTGKKMGRKK
ncbi:MAG TPA: electron transport complex subunit RsxC [Sphaerochaeta sp.]|nr:electron transport complex subunit RsxC [Sphaerochaeta sp.]